MNEFRIRVLLIEDDEEDVLLTRELLDEAPGLSFETTRVGCLEDGLESLRENRTDIVLLDLQLPDSQGLETFVRLRTRYPNVPVVLLTGASDEELSMLAIQEGAQDYLAKGHLDRDRMVRAIRYAIERNRADLSLKRYRDHLEDLVSARTRELQTAKEALEREVEERRLVQDERNALENQLGDARRLEAVGRLAGGVAHEFNNALTVILGYGELLLDRMSGDEPMRPDMQEIVKAAERAANLTRQLLAFSRRQVMRARTVDMHSLVMGAMAIAEPLLPDDIECDAVPPDEQVYVSVDMDQIEQVLRNLTENARDAMPDGGKLTIRAENVIVDDSPAQSSEGGGRFVCLHFEDSGTGMDGETLEQAFEPFFSTKEFGQGTGLGLSVVYGILRQHGGWVEAASTPGAGSTFRLFFPAVTTDSEFLPQETAASAAKEVQGGGEHLLLVEDEVSVREFLERAMRRHGYEVSVAGSGREALQIFEDIRDDCVMVFTDVVLPDCNGLDLIEELLERKEDLKILMSSGYSDGKSHREAIEQKNHSFLAKPYSLSELLSTIGQVLKM